MATRRQFLQQAGLLGLASAGCLPGQPSGSKMTPALWDGPSSIAFGLDREGRLLDPASAYQTSTSANGRLSFDISNNQIACAVDHRGLLDRAVVQIGIVPNEAAATPVGAYVDKVLVRGGPWPIALHLDGQEPVKLNELPQPSVTLRNNLFPLFQWLHHGIEIRMLAFAPIQLEPHHAPRVIVALVGCKNTTTAEVSGRLSAPDAACLLNGQSWTGSRGEFRFGLPAGSSIEIPLGFTLGTNADNPAGIADALKLRSAQDLFESTLRFHQGRYGRLTIPDGNYFAELFERSAELARQSLLQLPVGEFGGSFNGSDLPDASTVWMKDCFYSALPQSFLDPELCAEAILFFLKWGIPSRLLGPGVPRFPGASPVTNSLGNSVAGLALAGTYYQMTADRNFFRKHPEILTRGEEILNAVLSSRREAPYLFPSLYVSDGEARGDFHTGSNVIAWYAFKSMARLAREIYDAPGKAESWASIAAKIEDGVWTRCTAAGTYGKQFVEGAMADETFFKLHDGEESDTTLMPFYGFCAPDDPAYRNHARLAVTPENPYFFQEREGIWWYAHGKWSSATFPGWMTALAGANTEEELVSRLQRIRSLTDADGSFWWWPYRHDAFHASKPGRTNVKCGWAAGVFACLFTNTILGIRVDVPSAQVAFRPFSPWNAFTWKNARLGASVFNFDYKRDRGVTVAEIENLNEAAFAGTTEILLPAERRVLSCLVNGKTATNFTTSLRLNRSAVKVTGQIPAGGRLRVEAIYEE